MADEKDNVTRLDDDQFTKMAELVANKIIASTNLKDQQPPSSPPEQKQEVNNNPGTQFSADEIAVKVAEIFKQQSTAENQKIFNTMWSDKLNNVLSNTPGLSEYLDGSDDYGRVRRDELNKIESYEDRISALNKVKESFSEAKAGSSGRRPIIDEKAKKKAEESETRYSEVSDKLNKGDYSNIEEFTKDFMSALSEEVDGLQA